MHLNKSSRLKMNWPTCRLGLLSTSLALAAALSTGCSQQELSVTLFEDVTPASGLGEYVGMTYGAGWGDFDGDGHIDLHNPVDAIGSVAVLLPIFTFMTMENVHREKEFTTRLLLEKGAALIKKGADSRALYVRSSEAYMDLIKASQVAGLIKDKVVTGGMIPKISSCREALLRGVREIDIIDGRVPHAMLKIISTTNQLGTRFVKG